MMEMLYCFHVLIIIMLVLAAPTLNPNAPVITSVSTSVVTRSTITLSAEFSTTAVYAGTVYCAAFPSGTVIASNREVLTAPRSGKSGYLAGAQSADVTISGLSAITTYTTYCAVVTINGVDSVLADTLSTVKAVETACCKLLTFTNAPRSVYGDLTRYSASPASQYVFDYVLSSAPGSTVTVTPTLTASSNGADPTAVTVRPSSVTITSTSTALTGRFVLSAIAAVNGTFTVTLTPSGTSAAQFSPASTLVTVLKSSFARPPPNLSSAKFANNGGSVGILFDGPTNKAAVTASTFACSQVFEFTGASAATCSWISNSAVRAMLGAGSTLLPNDVVTVKAGLVKAECPPSTSCTDYKAAASQSVVLSLADDAIAPTVLLTTPAVVSSCDNVTIDPSLSSGAGGRAWSAVVWSVMRAEANTVGSAPNVLAALNARGKAIGTPIVLTRTLFSPATYTVTLTLTNFLGKSSSATTIFKLDENPNLPIVTILGPAVVTMTPSEALQLFTTTLQASCAERSSTIRYKWTASRNGAVVSLPSKSSTPSRFSLLSYALTAGNVYTFLFEATASATQNTDAITGRASVTVQVVNGAVQAVVVGGYKRQVPTSGTLAIDASASYDENVSKTTTSTLAYAWTCVFSNPANFGSSCASVLPATVNQNKLNVDASLLDSSFLYDFRVTVTATDGRSGSATVSVQPQLGESTTYTSITSLVTKINADSRLGLSGVVRAGSYGLDCSWTAAVDSTEVSFTALTPRAESFSRVAVRSDFTFPLVVPGNTFLPGSTVTFRLNAHLAGDSSKFGAFSEVTVKVNSPPSGGTVSATPPSGDALSTIFTASSASWLDDLEDFPLTYQFQYRTSAASQLLVLQARTPSNKVSTDLPAGPDSLNNAITIVCSVFDAFSAWSTKSTTVTVRENTDLDVEQYVTDQLDNFDSVGDVNTVGQLIGNVATTVNKVNCTNANAAFCAGLNRDGCSKTPQTCSSCVEGFVGVLGDANTMCFSSTRRKLTEQPIGGACSADADCLFAHCVNSVCVAPPKTCPSDTSAECSGHGSCVHTSPSGRQVDHVCSVLESECHARCVCEEGYGGRACGMTTARMISQDGIRAALCDAVVTVGNNSDPSVELLGSLFGYLDAAFDPDEVFTAEGKAACEDAMLFVGGLVKDNADLLAGMETAEIDVLVQTASKFVIPKKASDKTDGSFLGELMSQLHVAILASMVNGQDSYSYATSNMRTVVTKARIGGTTSLSPPLTAEAQFYGDSGLHSHIEVVNSASTSPFLNSEGYLAMAVMLWGSNPFPNASAVQSPMLRVENYNLPESERRLSEEAPHSRSLLDEPDFYIVLQLNEKHSFDLRYTMEEAAERGLLNTTFPECTNYDGAQYIDCTGCELSTYTDFNVTFACSALTERRALSTAVSSVSQFGTVLTTPSAIADSPTFAPTSAPASSSSSSSKDDTALIIAVAVGVGGGLLLLALAAYFLLSGGSSKRAVAPEAAAQRSNVALVTAEP